MDVICLLGQNQGLLPTRGSVMLDFVFLAMFVIVLVLGVSIYLVRYRRLFELHKQIQVTTGIVLLVVVVAFEVDIRFYTDWQALAAPSSLSAETIRRLLWIHLFFAVPTPFLWVFVIWHGLTKFPRPATPGPYSRTHIFWGWLAVIGMVLTAITGWIFYYAAFVA